MRRRHRPFGARVRAERLARGLGQKQVAGDLGITVGFLSRIERGLQLPSVPIFVALCYVLEVSADQLLGMPSARRTEGTHE